MIIFTDAMYLLLKKEARGALKRVTPGGKHTPVVGKRRREEKNGYCTSLSYRRRNCRSFCHDCLSDGVF
jgi:hypothetical protein